MAGQVTITGDSAAKLADVKSGDDICVTVGEITAQDDGTFTAQAQDAYKMGQGQEEMNEGETDQEGGNYGSGESADMPMPMGKGKMNGMRPAVALILSHGGK